MKMILFTLLFLLASPALAALSLDGSNTGGTTTGSVTTITLTTSDANDVIIVQSANTASFSFGINSITDTAGLTWHRRLAQVVNGVISNEEWYAVSPNVLSSDTVTITYGSAPTARVFVFGVNGANQASPFDPDFSSAALGTSTTSGTSNTITYSTATANDMLISFVKVNSTFGTLTPPSGTGIAGSPFTSVASYYRILSATQSSATNVYSWTQTGQDSVQILDAIQQATPTTGSSIITTAF